MEGVAPISPVFAYEWQAKDLHDRECVRVANKGVARRPFCASRARRESDGELVRGRYVRAELAATMGRSREGACDGPWPLHKAKASESAAGLHG